MRRLGIVLVSFLLLADAYGANKKPFHRGSDEDRAGCCDNSKEIKKIRKTALDIEIIVEDIAELLEGLDCSDSAMDIIQEQVTDINSLVDALLNNGEPGCCGPIATSLSLAAVIESEISAGPEIACCDTVTEIQSLLSVIDSKITFISSEACCNQVVQISSILDSIENKLSLFDTLDTTPCPATPIMTGPYTIAVSGHYCLAADVTGDSTAQAVITIDASDVFLDLNGHAVIVSDAQEILGDPFGIQVNENSVVITNGFITTTGTFTTSFAAGIAVEAANDVVIKNINLLARGTVPTDVKEGIYINNSQNVTVDNVCASNFTFDGLAIDGSTHCVVTNSTFFGNGLTGIYMTDGSEWNLIKNCVAKQNNPANNSSNIYAGFQINDGCSYNTISYCVADSNLKGFGFLLGVGPGSTPVGPGNVVLRCTASNNFVGFRVVSDVALSQLIKECIAINNTTGFEEAAADLSVSVIEFVSNVASQNGNNYDLLTNPVYHTPESVNHTISGLQGPSYWSNVFTN